MVWKPEQTAISSPIPGKKEYWKLKIKSIEQYGNYWQVGMKPSIIQFPISYSHQLEASENFL